MCSVEYCKSRWYYLIYVTVRLENCLLTPSHARLPTCKCYKLSDLFTQNVLMKIEKAVYVVQTEINCTKNSLFISKHLARAHVFHPGEQYQLEHRNREGVRQVPPLIA